VQSAAVATSEPAPAPPAPGSFVQGAIEPAPRVQTGTPVARKIQKGKG
jgi:hypothetical protein